MRFFNVEICMSNCETRLKFNEKLYILLLISTRNFLMRYEILLGSFMLIVDLLLKAIIVYEVIVVVIVW
jgi:hypothetical protein